MSSNNARFYNGIISYCERLKLWLNIFGYIITKYSIEKLPCKFHDSDNSYLLPHHHERTDLLRHHVCIPNSRTVWAYKTWLHPVADSCIICQFQNLEMVQMYYVTANYIVNIQRLAEKMLRDSYEKWGLSRHKWDAHLTQISTSLPRQLKT